MKNKKVILGVLAVLVVVAVAVFATNPAMFQGRLSLERPLTRTATKGFSDNCKTLGMFGPDNWYVVELQDMTTSRRSKRCRADDWIISEEAGVIGSIERGSQQLKFKRLSTGSINVRAAQLTDDNYLVISLD